jgi:hypothetical protein
LKIREAKLGPEHPNTLSSRSNLATAYERLGRWAEAESLRRDLLARRRKSDPPDSPALAGDLANLGLGLLHQEKWSEAETALRECLAIRAKAQPDDWPRFNTMSLLGGALQGQGRYTEAEPLIVPGYEGLKGREARLPRIARPRLDEAAQRVIRLDESWGRREQAAAWRARRRPARRGIPPARAPHLGLPREDSGRRLRTTSRATSRAFRQAVGARRPAHSTRPKVRNRATRLASQLIATPPVPEMLRS